MYVCMRVRTTSCMCKKHESQYIMCSRPYVCMRVRTTSCMCKKHESQYIMCSMPYVCMYESADNLMYCVRNMRVNI